MGYVGRYSLGERFAAECIGTALFTFLSLSAVANNLLPRTKGHAMGFAWVALAFGAALGISVAAFAPISDHFNPGLVLGSAIAGNIDWKDVPALCFAEFLGAFVGAVLVWMHFLPHFQTKPTPPPMQPNGYFLNTQDVIRRDALQMASYSSVPVASRQRHAFENTMQEVKRYLKDGPVTAAHSMKNRRRNSVQIGEINRRHSIDPDFKDAKQGSQLKRLERGNSIVVADLKRYLERLEELERARQVALNAPLPDKEEHQADNVALLESDDMKEHVKEEDLAIMADQNIKLSVFATRPALYAPWWDLGCEISASALLVLLSVIFTGHIDAHLIEAGKITPQLFSLKAFYSAMLMFGIIIGLGGPTGPAMNASRDLSPRLVHFLFPISGKGGSEWEYAWVPVLGNFIGGGVAGPSMRHDADHLGQIFSKDTQALFYNYKPGPVQRMLDFDYLCGRNTPSVAAVIKPGSGEGFEKLFFGKTEMPIASHGSIKAAAAAHPRADVFVNFASFRSAFQSTMDALQQPTIHVVAIIAEGVPEKDTKELIAYAKKHNKIIIGPATVGGIQAGAFKIGDTAGTLDNIIACKLYRPGSVGFVSKSGGMSNEAYNILARNTDGLYEGIAIGGDVFPGSTLSDHAIRFNTIPQVKMIVVLGEIGGEDEYSLVDALKEGKIKKPVIAWVSGTCAKLFTSEVQFGHAGAKSGGDRESAQAKNAALKDAGAIVPDSFESLAGTIKYTYDELVSCGVITPAEDFTPPFIPEDIGKAKREGKVRIPTSIISTISDDRGEEPTYGGVSISKVVEGGMGVGDVISLLWFKRSLPRYGTQFLEMCLMICADHGPNVSGAHNTIVCSRAGKDIVSCLTSGLLCIGPRFGGAVDDAARYFSAALDQKKEPDAFVEEMKKKGIRVPGIGHRVKSKDNPDKRVELLISYAHKNFPTTKYLDYALRVEDYTLTKSSNLILNVDGAIGALFVDLLHGCGMFSEGEIADIIEVGYVNALFVLARSIGFLGHALDQKRLKQPLYRHPGDDVLFA